MSTSADELVQFHVFGVPSIEHTPTTHDMIPAPLTPYLDLAGLRFDYPLVLTDEAPYVASLTELVNRALQLVAPRGATGERLRRIVLDVEAEVRALLEREQRAPFTELWDLAVRKLISSVSDVDALLAGLGQVRNALPVNGRLVDCDDRAAADVVSHVWQMTQRRASDSVRQRIDELVLGLFEILRAQDARSIDARSPERLSASIGGAHRSSFDFEAWSDLLRSGPAANEMSAARGNRIRAALSVLETQRFFPADATGDADERHSFLFHGCIDAAEAYRARMPDMVELVRAMAIAELEVQNAYASALHDPFFDHFDENSLTPADLAVFPSYLAALTDRELTPEEQARLVDVLGSDAPIKVLVDVTDILGEPGGPPLINGSERSVVGRQLGRMAMGLGGAFVVQAASSDLHQVSGRIRDGLESARPALFSVFTGSRELVPHLSSYLVAAAAMRSRAFPTFTYDPDAGPGWADRLDIDPNPEVRTAWPAGRVDYEDAELQRHAEEALFTPVEFAALDRRYIDLFTIDLPESWNGEMRPAATLIDAGPAATNGDAPYILMADADSQLHRVVVDPQVLHIARRLGETWWNLQDLAGIHDVDALALVEAERAKWEEERASEATRPDVTSQPADTIREPPVGRTDDRGTTVTPSPVDEPADEAPAPGEPYIETVRCTTCDECTAINPRMFAYDDNKQAYIADLAAGTYRDMIEAAEACQVAIIHPGAPWDPTEAGLDELITRAAAFA